MAGAKRGWTVHNWWHMSYSPVTGLVYVPTTDRRATLERLRIARTRPGERARGHAGFRRKTGGLGSGQRIGALVGGAADCGQQQHLSTAGNLVFQGEGTGEFSAYAADSGKKLWSLKTGSAIDATPVSFSAGGQQYIVVPVGWGSASRIFGPASLMATPTVEAGAVEAAGF